MHLAHRPFSPLLALCAAVSLLLSACAGARGFERPNGVALDAGGSLYVMDFGNYRIAQVQPDGRLMAALGSFGTRPDQIFYGWDLATDR